MTRENLAALAEQIEILRATRARTLERLPDENDATTPNKVKEIVELKKDLKAQRDLLFRRRDSIRQPAAKVLEYRSVVALILEAKQECLEFQERLRLELQKPKAQQAELCHPWNPRGATANEAEYLRLVGNAERLFAVGWDHASEDVSTPVRMALASRHLLPRDGGFCGLRYWTGMDIPAETRSNGQHFPGRHIPGRIETEAEKIDAHLGELRREFPELEAIIDEIQTADDAPAEDAPAALLAGPETAPAALAAAD